MAGIRELHTVWSAWSVCILSVFIYFQNSAFAQIRSVLLNPTENGKYTVVEISENENISYFPYSINNLGQVVGYSVTSDGYCRAFLWTELEGFKDLSKTLGSDPASIAYGINDSNQIVGESFPKPYNLGRAFLETDFGGMVQIVSNAGAAGINNAGLVCGTSQKAGSLDLQPFVWSKSQGVQFIGTLGGNGYFNVARHINDSNQIVGGSSNDFDDYTHAYLWSEPNDMNDLGTLPGDMVSMAECVNDTGQVVGWSRNLRSAGSQDRAFIWNAKTGMTELPSLCGLFDTEALAINNLGTAVGRSKPLQIKKNWLQHAVIWQNNTAIDLNELIEDQSLDYKLTHAIAINDKGQILAVSDSCYIFKPVTMAQITFKKCSIKAGKENQDSISISGLFDADYSDFLIAMGGNVGISLNCDTMQSYKVFTFPINEAACKKGRFYAKTSNTSFKFDAENKKFTFTAKKTDLTGLACPIIVTITIGDYYAQAELDETIVNGKLDCPFPLMMGVMDCLEVVKYKNKTGNTDGEDAITAQGIFTIDGDFNPFEPIVIKIGSQTFTVPYSSFSYKSGVYTCKNILAEEDGTTKVSVKLDTEKCTFTLLITKASIEDIGIVNFDIDCFGNSLEKLETITLN